MIIHFTQFVSMFVAIMLFASPTLSSDPYWLSEPGYCDADDRKIEEDDIIYLTRDSIDSHSFSCSWPSAAGEALLKDNPWVNIFAKCSNDTTSWNTEFEIAQQSDGSVRLFQKGGGIPHLRLHLCERQSAIQQDNYYRVAML